MAVPVPTATAVAVRAAVAELRALGPEPARGVADLRGHTPALLLELTLQRLLLLYELHRRRGRRSLRGNDAGAFSAFRL